MQHDEQHGEVETLTSGDPSSVVNDRSDRQMKDLLRISLANDEAHDRQIMTWIYAGPRV